MTDLLCDGNKYESGMLMYRGDLHRNMSPSTISDKVDQ